MTRTTQFQPRSSADGGHTGVAHLAMLADAPIVLVGIVGTERAQPIGAVVPRPFRGHVGVRFGEPIHPADYRHGGSRRKRQQMLSDVMAAIAALTDQGVSPEFASDEPPLVRGGTESVDRVTCHRGVALSWHRAAEPPVDAGCSRHGRRSRPGRSRLRNSFDTTRARI